jgi:hypothetical protein
MKKVVNLSEYELNKIVKKILMSEQPTPGPAIPGAPVSQTPRATSPTSRATSPTSRATSPTTVPQAAPSQTASGGGRPLPTPFNPQHKGTFEVDCKSGLSKLGYPGKLSKEGNKLFVDLFCNPKYRNR